MAPFQINNLCNLLKKHTPHVQDVQANTTPVSSSQQLPHDVWQKVYEILDLLDSIMFSCVCKEFRSISISTNHPRLSDVLLVIRSPKQSNELELFSFKDSKKYKIPLPETIFESSSRCLGSSFGHLIFQHHQTRNIILWNPLSKNQISLPPMLFEIKKVTLSSKSTKQGNFFAICADRNYIYTCKPDQDQDWTKIPYAFLDIDEIFYYNNRLFVSDLRAICQVNLVSNPRQIIWCRSSLFVRWDNLMWNSYFLESFKGELLFIQKLRLNDGEFKVCIGKFDDKINEWKQMNLNHGYYYIFLSNGFGFNYKGDSICLSRDEGKHSEFCLSQDWIYFTDNNSFGRFQLNSDDQGLFKIIYNEPPTLGNCYCWLSPDPY